MAERRFEPRDPDFEARVRASFAQQTLMHTLGAEILLVRPGEVHLVLPFGDHLTQQHGFAHAGALTTLADSGCGYAALSLMAPGDEVLSVEFKVNLLAPGVGERFVAECRVVRPGRTLTVCAADVFADRNGERTHVSVMQATMIRSTPS